MLFKNDVEPSCIYCRYGTALGRNEYACEKHGIMDGSGYCGAFRYEPTKRIPPVMPRLDFMRFSEDDFTL